MTKFFKLYIYNLTLLLAVFSATILQSQNFHLQHFTVADGLPQQEVIDISLDQFGYLWIHTQGGEITRFNGEKFEILPEKLFPDVFLESTIEYKELPKIAKQQIKKHTINKIIKDKQSVIWIATSRGLYKVVENNFKHLNGHEITSLNIFKDKLLIGSPNNLTQLDSNGFSPLLKNKYINSVKSNSNQIFAGSDNSVFVLDSLKVIDTIEVKGKINRILIHDSKFWVATSTNGIFSFSYDLKTENTFNFIQFDESDGVYDLNITDIQVDRIGRLWYASKKGFLGFINKNKVRHLGKILNTDVTVGTLVFHNTKIFLGTQGKGVWWSEVNENLKFNKLEGIDRLNSENVNQLLFDSRDNLWIGTHKGLNKVLLDADTQIKDVEHFGKNDGFLGIETTKNAITEDRNGNLWFGTVNGLMKYNFSNIENRKHKPEVFFERIEVDYNTIDTIANVQNSLELKPTENNIGFKFKTVDLSYPDEIEYRWKLNTDDWSPWSKEQNVNYSSLNPGLYEFHVQSRVHKTFKSDILNYKFNIATPLVDKLWFRALIISALVLLLVSLFRRYLYTVREKNKRKEQQLKTENYLLSLEQKALQLQMNPHFIFNVLNGIKSMGATNIDLMNDTVNKFAALLRLTLSNSRKENITLKEEVSILKNYIDIEKLMSQNPFEYTVNLPKDFDAEEILIPPMLIQPFVENAIKHGISSVKNGKLDIYFSVKDEFLYCTIQDNGIGIEVSKKSKQKTSHQSMALEVTRERIESISGKESFEIKEVKDKSQNIEGTKVVFKIPLLTDY